MPGRLDEFGETDAPTLVLTEIIETGCLACFGQ
jgi:hypothetical protein